MGVKQQMQVVVTLVRWKYDLEKAQFSCNVLRDLF